ncbi:MAG: TSUP family transporter, partial [Actinomycetota bacterium]|nr:TSUP family transporter [Actinomycetota bacterium]
ALKGVQSLVVNLVAAAVFVVTGHVHWTAAVLLAVGASFGAHQGVRLARLLPSSAIRVGVVATGVVVAVVLLLP